MAGLPPPWPDFGSLPGGMKDGFPVSIAELLTAGERPLPSEAVAIVLDVCAQVLRRPASPSVLPAITAGAVFLDASGSITVAGGVPVEDDQTVLLLGRMLLQMLPVAGTPLSARVPARLKQLAARAAAGDGPRLSVARFAAALRGFGPEQAHAAIRNLFERWHARTSRIETQRASSRLEEAVRSSRQSSAGPGVFHPLLEVADETLHRAGGAADAPATLAADRPRGMLRRARTAVIVVILLLAGAGAAYWLNADERLPQLPLSPAIFTTDPEPAGRDGWELLPGRGPLAVEHDPARQLVAPSVVPGSMEGVIGQARQVGSDAVIGQHAAHRP